MYISPGLFFGDQLYCIRYKKVTMTHPSLLKLVLLNLVKKAASSIVLFIKEKYNIENLQVLIEDFGLEV